MFLEASDEVLVKRFKEARRNHPLSLSGRILNGIALERARLKEVKDVANNIIDTSKFTNMDLRREITRIYGDEDQVKAQLTITVVSFGFKYGIPLDSDLLFDVRFLPNPYCIQN